MDKRLFVFGLGFTGLRFARAMKLLGWHVAGTVTSAQKANWIHDLGIEAHVFDGSGLSPDLTHLTRSYSHILSTIPPTNGWTESAAKTPDPVLAHITPAAPWTTYLSTTGVYGDHEGGWVDETTPALGGTNRARQRADEDWRAFGATLFRLPGIYGPGRSVIERAERGQLSRVDKPGHVFSRIHVDDIVQALIASAHRPTPGEIFNISDDEPTAPHVVEDYACDLLGIEPAPLKPYKDAALSPRAQQFYSQFRRVRNTKMKEVLDLSLLYPTYKEGLRACLAARHTKPRML
ncbi:MAG: SDR family oxidoreductase [Pseudomonadota bacterium]